MIAQAFYISRDIIIKEEPATSNTAAATISYKSALLGWASLQSKFPKL